MNHIIIYACEFTPDVWKEYCDICGVDYNAVSIDIKFDFEDVTAIYDEDDLD